MSTKLTDDVQVLPAFEIWNGVAPGAEVLVEDDGVSGHELLDEVTPVIRNEDRLVHFKNGNDEHPRKPRDSVNKQLNLNLLPFFASPTPTLMAFTGVTNAHGPSPQPTACRSPSCSLTTATGSNHAQSKV